MTKIVSKAFPTVKGAPFLGVLREFRRNPLKFMIEINSPLTEKESKIYKETLKGYLLPRSETKEKFIEFLTELGFSNIKFYEKKKELDRSCWSIHKRAKQALPISLVLSKLKIIPKMWHEHVKANFNQKIIMDQNIVTYGAFVCDKI